MEKEQRAALKKYQKKSHLQNDLENAALGSGFMGTLIHPEGAFGSSAGDGRMGRVGRGMAGSALGQILDSEAADAAIGEDSRGTKAYEALRGGLSGAADGITLAGTMSRGKALLKYLMINNGLSKSKAITAMFGIPALIGGTAGAGAGALFGVSKDDL